MARKNKDETTTKVAPEIKVDGGLSTDTSIENFFKESENYTGSSGIELLTPGESVRETFARTNFPSKKVADACVRWFNKCTMIQWVEGGEWLLNQMTAWTAISGAARKEFLAAIAGGQRGEIPNPFENAKNRMRGGRY